MRLFRLVSLSQGPSPRALKASALAVLCVFMAVCVVNHPEKTRAQEDLALAQSELSTVTADNVTLTGNVTASLVTVQTAQGEQRNNDKADPGSWGLYAQKVTLSADDIRTTSVGAEKLAASGVTVTVKRGSNNNAC